MTEDPKKRNLSQTGGKGKSLHQKMEDARARRAEVLAMKIPTNDDANVPQPSSIADTSNPLQTKPEPSKPAQSKSAIPKPTAAPSETVHETPAPAPADRVSTEPTKPLSRSLPRTGSEPRFPTIVMPDPKQDPIKDKPNNRRVVLPTVGLLGLIVATLYFVPETKVSTTPIGGQSIAAPSRTSETMETTLTSPETTLVPEGNSAILDTSTTTPNITPKKDTSPLPSEALETPRVTRVNAAFEQPPIAPLAARVWQRLPLPDMPREPTPDPLFSLPPVNDLNISLIIPAKASHATMRNVSTALKDSGFKINEPRLVSFAIETTHVRYYNAQDARAANTLAQNIGSTARDFTEYAPAPPKGSVEVFIQSQTPSAVPRPVLRGAPQHLDRFGRDIRETLRSITRQ